MRAAGAARRAADGGRRGGWLGTSGSAALQQREGRGKPWWWVVRVFGARGQGGVGGDGLGKRDRHRGNGSTQHTTGSERVCRRARRFASAAGGLALVVSFQSGPGCAVQDEAAARAARDWQVRMPAQCNAMQCNAMNGGVKDWAPGGHTSKSSKDPGPPRGSSRASHPAVINTRNKARFTVPAHPRPSRLPLSALSQSKQIIYRILPPNLLRLCAVCTAFARPAAPAVLLRPPRCQMTSVHASIMLSGHAASSKAVPHWLAFALGKEMHYQHTTGTASVFMHDYVRDAKTTVCS